MRIPFTLVASLFFLLQFARGFDIFMGSGEKDASRYNDFNRRRPSR
jgi:hypothetical protein